MAMARRAWADTSPTILRHFGSPRFSLRGGFVSLLLAALAVSACKTTTYEIPVVAPARAVDRSLASVRVEDFESDSDDGADVAEAIRNGIVREGFIDVTASRADAVLSGSLRVGDVHSEEGSEIVEISDGDETRRVRRYFIRKRSTVSLSYALSADGRRLAGNDFSFSFDQEWRGDSRRSARSRAATDEKIQATLLARVVPEVVADVSPHREVRELELRKGGHPGLVQGIVYMKNERYDQAFGIWRQVAEQASEASDRAAARYNMGVVKEVRGEHEDAFALFREADQLDPGNELYIEALSRVEEAKRQRTRLEQQLGHDVRSRLTVKTSPPDSRVRIMNIRPVYHDGIYLEPGRYDILVDHPGYDSQRRWIVLDGTDRVVEVELVPR